MRHSVTLTLDFFSDVAKERRIAVALCGLHQVYGSLTDCQNRFISVLVCV